jgi:uncharacterized membrane protein (DUF4010 family)
VFQIVWIAVEFAQRWFGGAGLVLSSLILGLTDVDALTSSLALRARETLPPDVAASGIALGIVSNTMLKAGLTIAIGRRAFWVRAAPALAAMATAGLVSLLWAGRLASLSY